eukprot:TRINITY_DN45750_c0_g1_i1.p1 TRINITY_DN45750_c0_g1~~TRINITY_DN45750_c0_g1_i1.p1  ORF type:complete len:119 (-),score=26.93 TRINITY_DN45750_c0_g1_i1:171-527(-)
MAGRLSTTIILAVLAVVIDVSAYRKREANEDKIEAAMKSQETSATQTNGTAEVGMKTKTLTSELLEAIKTQIDEIEKSEKDEGKTAMLELKQRSFAGAQAVSLLVLCAGLSSVAFNIP